MTTMVIIKNNEQEGSEKVIRVSNINPETGEISQGEYVLKAQEETEVCVYSECSLMVDKFVSG